MVLKLKIHRSHLRMLEEEARRSWPIEACAVLIGRRKGELNEVTDVRVVQNVDRSPVAFRIDPLVLYDIYKRAEEEGNEIIGIFHSHPAPPRPSGIDIEYMKITSMPWLIMSMPHRSLGVYVWEADGIKEVRLEVLE